MFQWLQPLVVKLAVPQRTEKWSHPLTFHRSRKEDLWTYHTGVTVLLARWSEKLDGRPSPTPVPPDGRRRTIRSRPSFQVSLSCMYPQHHESRSKLPVQQMFWTGTCKMGRPYAVQYRRSKDRTCDPWSASKIQQSPPSISSPPPTPALSAEKNSDDSTFLQLNDNGIGNKLTELGVVLERNNVKVAFIQESKLPSKSKNPCIQNYTTVRTDRSHGHGGGLLIFIHRSITSTTIVTWVASWSPPGRTADIGNTKMIISNIYIPSAHSCSNGYNLQ